MRVLSSTDHNELRIQDTLSGGELVIYYRTPKKDERAGYQANTIVRKGKKIRLNIFNVRQEYGIKILTGIRDGDFGVPGDGPDGIVPISSDPTSEFYRKDWKALMEEYSADIIQTLSSVVFEGVRVEGDHIEFETGDEIEDDEPGAPEKAEGEEDKEGPLGE